MSSFKPIAGGSVTTPRGFRAAGVTAGFKRSGAPDFAMLVSDVPANFAGAFTSCTFAAAPVQVCRKRVLASDTIRAAVINSGNANACTGAQGLKDAHAMAALTASYLSIPEQEVLVCSTGRIGVTMPMDNVETGIKAATTLLSTSEESAHHLAEAIMTSDTRSKEVAVEFKLNGRAVRIAGICKGAGMIQPGMSPTGQRPAAMPLHATMLCFLTTDAYIDHRVLKKALQEAVALSFNRITVDGDMSTNDSVIILANGLAGNKKITSASKSDLAAFQAALNHVTLSLAKMIVSDGEGVSRFVTVRVNGAAYFADADAAARAVANSALVKTSWCGGDPNWGRILDALGYSSARVVEEKVDLGYSLPDSKKVLFSLKKGQPTTTPLDALRKITTGKAFDLHINLNVGKSAAIIYTADLTEEYVDFNKGE